MKYRKNKFYKGKIILIVLVIVAMIFSGYFGYNLFREHQYIATVVIDPGHGGYDVGSIGYDGSYINVVYTRSNDTVDWADNEEDDLIGRVIFANEQNADYFFSIHLNASENTAAYGYNAFIRSNDPASETIANSIDNNLTEENWLYNRGLEYTNSYPLYVVDNLDIPSMLFEVGFITNPQECADLKKVSNQELIAECIANAYNDYIVSTIKG